MTSSLPLLAGAVLVAGLIGVPATGTTTSERRQTSHGWTGDTEPGVPAVAEHLGAESAAERRRVLAYWTPGRMAAAAPVGLLGPVSGMLGAVTGLLGLKTAFETPAARPSVLRVATVGTKSPPVGTTRTRYGARVGGARWGAGGQVARTTGRVFMTLGGTDFVCSASSVRSANLDLVVTAGHCVKNGTGAWADNWVFVPGYDRGRKPYGQFTARRMFVPGAWARGGDDSHDIGMVAVNPRGGRHLAQVVGVQDIAFDTARGRQTHGFGFPADLPYDGENLVYCAGPVRDDPHGQTSDQGLRCDMTAGSSGGPWLSGFDPATGHGTVTSVSSFKYSDDRGTMYGPYFGEAARRLYAAAQRS
ncbi:trypsin-like serine peptidase [Streptosporangium saharense]|uniref:trypsin-like serine peptidase n=1 Tax=Streptosporangium saharense TaxID=1706840 RepID=UPI0033317D1F